MSLIDSNVKRGSAELAVLSLLERGPLHGYEIAKLIGRETDDVLRFDVASLYPLLYRMEKNGWLTASWEQIGSSRRRRRYRLTETGRKQLAGLRSQWKSFFRALKRLGGLGRPAVQEH